MSSAPPARANALDSLAETLRAHLAAGPHVQFGGEIVEASRSFIRIAGLRGRVAVGDRVTGAGAAAPDGEVVQIGPSGALAALYDSSSPASLGQEIYLGARQAFAPCAAWRGRVIDAFASPIDGRGPLARGATSTPIEQAPPPPLRRRRIETPVTTGVRVIDAFTPICLGQRIGVFAGSGVGKSSLLGMLAACRHFDTVVVGLIGERGREVREFVEDIIGPERDDAIVVAATGDESPLTRRLAARTSVAIAEWFRDRGENVLLIVDSATRYAHAAREIAIAAGESPVARGYPPSVFAELPRLLERAGPGVEGAGTITGVFSVLVDGDDHNDPVADAIRGILDGHIVLQRAIADQGRYPAVDISASISRLADKCWTSQQAQTVRRLRRLAARFEDSRDLRAIGGYRAGADAELDEAVAIVPALYAALAQMRGAAPSADAFSEIAQALRAARPQEPAQ